MNPTRGVTEALLASAKEQFLEKGYDKASLRTICAGAGVTTGALYFAFENKNALFETLVAPTMEKLDEISEQLQTVLLENDGEGFNEQEFNDFMFQFLVENREDIQLLMARAEGSQYEGFNRKIYAYVETLMTHYSSRVAGVELDQDLIHILTNMYLAAISNLIARGGGSEHIKEMADDLRTVMESGFRALMEQRKSDG